MHPHLRLLLALLTLALTACGSDAVIPVPIALGDDHTCVVDGGRVRCWGTNRHQQLGNPTRTIQTTPVVVEGLTEVEALAAGPSSTCALRRDGSLWCWGKLPNDSNGFREGEGVPLTQIAAPAFRSITMGDSHACAVDTDDHVWGWGDSYGSTFGIAEADEHPEPFRLPHLDTMRAVVCAGLGGCAVTAERTAVCWGLDWSDPTEPPGLRHIPLLRNVKSVAVGTEIACALTHEGDVHCWGYGRWEPRWPNFVWLSNPPANVLRVPQRIALPAPATEVGAGLRFGCARLQNGQVWCFGADGLRQHGDGGERADAAPSQVVDLPPTREGSLAVHASRACVQSEAGVTHCWGDDPIGRHGSGAPPRHLRPTEVPAWAGMRTLLASSSGNVCGLDMGGTVRCAGTLLSDERPPGESERYRTPQPIGGLAASTAISIGQSDGCAVDTNGAARCWGLRLVGRPSDTVFWTESLPLTDEVLSIDVSTRHGCLRHRDGSVRCWGESDGGVFGDGTADGVLRATPAVVPGLSNVTALVSNAELNCALESDGHVSCWGRTGSRQFGPTYAAGIHPRPERLALDRVRQVGLGLYTLCVLQEGDQLRCFGSNFSGELGSADRFAVESTLTLPGAVGLAVGWTHACAWTRDGAVWCWGTNFDGELGVGDHLPRTTPTRVDAIGPVHHVTAGDRITCALGDGRAWCWGSNLGGGFGLGAADLDTRPTAVRW